jgi:hypothetical protein
MSSFSFDSTNAAQQSQSNMLAHSNDDDGTSRNAAQQTPSFSGFSFGEPAAKPQQPQAPRPVFSFGTPAAAPQQPESSRPVFSIGATTTPAPQQQPAGAPVFSIGRPASFTPSTGAPVFSFGNTTAEPAAPQQTTSLLLGRSASETPATKPAAPQIKSSSDDAMKDDLSMSRNKRKPQITAATAPNGHICECCMCNEIRETVVNIDPNFSRTPTSGTGMTQGMDHATLLNTFDNDYQTFLQARKIKMEQAIEIAELEVKQLELDIKKARLQRVRAEVQLVKDKSDESISWSVWRIVAWLVGAWIVVVGIFDTGATLYESFTGRTIQY